jgi:type IV secretion system protein TrbE
MFDLRPYRQTGARLSDYLPWAALIAPGVVLNKDGSFQRTLTFRGPDLDSSAPAELQGVSQRLNNILRRFGSGWCLHIDATRRAVSAYPDADWRHPVAALIDEERRQMFAAAGARFESIFHMTLTWLAPAERSNRLESLVFVSADRDKPATDYRAHLERFIQDTDQTLALLEPLMPMARWLDDEETLTYLHNCISDRPHRVAVPAVPFHLDALLPDAALVGGLAPKLGGLHLKTLSVRSFVTETEPGLLDALNRLAIPYRWVTRFLPLDREEGRREIEKIRKRWFSKRKGIGTLVSEALFRHESVLQDNDAANQAHDADAALQALGADAVAAGYATLTITVADPSPDRAVEKIRAIQQVTDTLGFVTEVETVNAVEAWLGALPGSAYADVRRPIVLTPSLAHLAPTSAVWAGPERNAHLNGPTLMLAATDGATPFRLDLHVGDVGHTMIVGPTGAGKSVLLASLAAQWLRYRDAQVFVFDKGRSVRATILGIGGDFYDLGEDHALAFQPLRAVDTPDQRAWALDWLCALVQACGTAATPDQRAELWRALGLIGERPIAMRTLSVFAALVQDTELRTVLTPFTLAGPYGRLLDHDADTLRAGAVQAFEMEDLMRKPAAIAAVLGVVFRRLEQRFTGAPTLLILDEAWLFLKDAAFAAQIQDWLKTLRKRNVAVVFASQELADVEASPIAATLLEACASRIFLPNDRAREPRTRALYQSLGLNPRQIDLIASATPKRDYYFVNRGGARLFELGHGPAALAFVAAAKPEDQAAIDRVLAEHGTAGFAPAWLTHKGLPNAAAAVRAALAASTAPSVRVPEMSR